MSEMEAVQSKVRDLLHSHGLIDVLSCIVEETGLELLEPLSNICLEIAYTATISGDKDTARIWMRAAAVIKKADRAVFKFPFP